METLRSATAPKILI